MNRRSLIPNDGRIPSIRSFVPSLARTVRATEATAIVPRSDEFLASQPRLMEVAHLPWGLEIDVMNEGRRPWLCDAGGPSAATNSLINADSIRVAESLDRGHLFRDRMLSPGPRIFSCCRCRAEERTIRGSDLLSEPAATAIFVVQAEILRPEPRINEDSGQTRR